MHGGTIAELASSYQLSMLLKRYPFSDFSDQRRSVAYEKFIAAEKSCRKFNDENYKFLANPVTEDITEVFTFARSFINRVLGEYPEYPEIVEWSRHGPGATLSTIEGLNSQYHKFENWPYDCTKAALGHARLLISNDERWLGALQDSYRDVMEIPKHYPIDLETFWSSVFNVVKGNRVTFVPKDALQERTIAIEPTMNLCLQLGVDGYIRRRLIPFGVDLNSQDKNRLLARIGSSDGIYATLDLKAASDSISLKICRLLLPPIWYKYFLKLRSPYGEVGGEVLRYSKISSMGNGFTFALESLIFTAIIIGVLKHYRGRVDYRRFSVFGDDLIIETEYADLLIFYLDKFGFATNSDKTFIKGPVRESCGTDWFRGLLIRPVFLTEFPSDVKQLFSARNRIRRKLETQWGISSSLTEKQFDKWCPDVCLDIIGPPSNEEFDTYRHISFPYNSRYSKGHYWEFFRIITKPCPLRGHKFLFRKLMSSLRGCESPPRFWEGVKSGGSCFDVTKRGFVRLSVVTSLAYSWPEEYLTLVF
jgi:hypothetical protein